MTNSHADHLAAAHELAALIATVARRAEEDRRPDDAVIAAACDAGLFNMMSPRLYGGDELDLDTFFEVGLILAEADSSHSWVLDFYIEHVWMFCQFPATFQKELFDGRSYVLAPAMLSPSGRATPVSGGFELSGRWQWATGIVHADWVIAGALLTLDDKVTPMFFALRRSAVTVEDTWYMDGMCATGSQDVLIDGQFVPASQSVSIRDMLNATAPGSQVHAGPLYSTPMAPILSFAAALPILGQAKTAVREFATQLHSRYDPRLLEVQSNKSSRQSRLAEADLTVSAAEALARSVLVDVLATRARAGEAQRVRWTSSIAHVVSMCQSAINHVCEAAGASSHFLSNPLQRTRRDVNAMACHMVFDQDERRRCHGRALLGLPAESIWH